MSSGELVSIQCIVSGGDLPIQVTWKLNGESIPTNIDVSLSKVGKRINVLSIESVTAHHAGNYTCFASNKAGDAEYSSALFVIGLSSTSKLLNFSLSFLKNFNPSLNRLLLSICF